MKSGRIIAVFSGIIIALGVVGYVYYYQYFLRQNEKDSLIFKTITGEVKITVEYARTKEEWSKGLAERESLGAREGMLFVFPQEAYQAFWMKDVLISLDLVFINKDKSIIDIATLGPCRIDPCPIYTSKTPAQYVIETIAGFTQRNGISITDRVILPENTFH